MTKSYFATQHRKLGAGFVTPPSMTGRRRFECSYFVPPHASAKDLQNNYLTPSGTTSPRVRSPWLAANDP
ncbi:MAG: hypothetical protein H0A75_09000 [Candidatus Methanofishera endochildressiae]|uniref:Uncharacterized protein n=1 Tax=Candidatus Methanofishera endochildressiae TaxID=2738884 RepID=A0A7Z0MPT8_9GAMM|nr:hypothetical protein [Candidatus Methanofishera endochildressiae]